MSHNKKIKSARELLLQFEELSNGLSSGKFNKDFAEQASKEIVQDINRLYRDVIREFYADYKPYRYRRSYMLYNLMKTHLNGTKLRVSVSMSNIPSGWYRAQQKGKGDVFFENVYMKGWHGGTWQSEGRETWTGNTIYTVKPGMYYRRPFPTYHQIGRPAVKADLGPGENFNYEMEEYLSRDGITNIGKNIGNAVDNALEYAFSQYALFR